MEHLLRPRAQAAGNLSGPDEVEVLQTDVMRFMAILGFCLTVIFTLVRSLPVAPAGGPAIEDRVLLIREVRDLQASAEGLRAEVRAAERQLERALARKLELDGAAGKAQELLRELKDQVETAAKGSAMQRQRLQGLERQLQEEKRSLSEIRRETDAEKAVLSDLREKLAEAEKRIPKDVPAPETGPKTEPAPEPRPAEEPRKGFSLQFESPAALEGLIGRKEVGFFAMLGSRTWQLRLEGTVARFEIADKPREFHEMTPETVPGRYRKALLEAVAALGSSAVLWGVTLPERTRTAIQQAMAAHGSGTLVIDVRGGVKVREKS